jgi:hypothetical protein
MTKRILALGLVFGRAENQMRRVASCAALLIGSGIGAGTFLLACGGGPNEGGFGDDASTANTGPGGQTGGTSGDGGPLTPLLPLGDAGGAQPVTSTDGGCAGLQCAIATSCNSSGGTTIVGKVMDPAGANPLYNVLAYVPMYDPAQPSTIPPGYGIQPIVGGVNFPSGVSCNSCSYLYTGNPIAVGTSGTDGTFTITNAPSGTNIPVVVQIGKWRAHTTVSTVTDCNQADAGSISFPSSADGSDPIDSIPQIAISMGSADSLECLPYRIGMALSEFTSGPSSSGHIHIFTGGPLGALAGGLGAPPSSSGALWDSLTDLEKYDVSLFSCEAAETTNANPPLLEQYVNAGGRAFLSHYHYAWLAGPLQGGAGAGYTANADWGSNLASWNSNDQGADEGAIIGAKISTTLNVGGGTFAKGADLESWLSNVNALGTSGVASTEVAVNSPSFDPNVTSANAVSQAWATYDTTSATDQGFPTAYFSFDTPVGAAAPPDGGAPPYCGRVVFSGLHVGAAANDTTGGLRMPSSSSCNPGPGQLSPQEKVLEFMLFDLSACVTPDTAPPSLPIPPPAPPPK